MSERVSSIELGPHGPTLSVVLTDGIESAQRDPGLYKVLYNKLAQTLTITKADAVTTRYAAVNGVLNDLDRAAVVMLDKVQTTADLRRDAAPTEFTLYHVPKHGFVQDVSHSAAEKLGAQTEESKGLETILKQTSNSGRAVTWVEHSRGATVFNAAIRSLHAQDVKLKNQSAAVFGGAANNAMMRENLAEAGVPMIGKGFYNHPFDMVPQIVGANSLNPIKLVGSVLEIPFLFTKYSPHTWHHALKPGDYKGVQDFQWEKPGVDLRLTVSSPGFDMANLLTIDPAASSKLATMVGETMEQQLLNGLGSAPSVVLHQPSPAMDRETAAVPNDESPIVADPALALPPVRVFPIKPPVGPGLRH
jgi:hypothetical protein